jgi:foldase protein PrsA
MKKLHLAVLALVVLLAACGQKGLQLEKGTPIYDLAKEVAKSYPIVDPDANKVLIKCDYFTITPGVFFTEMQFAMGKRVQELKNYDKNRLPEYLKINIQRMGERKLLLEGAKKAGIVVTPKQLDSTLNVIFERSGGKENFLKRISGDGVTLETVQQDVEKEMTIRKFFDKIYAETTVSEQEIKDAYAGDKTASVRHILLLTQGQSDSVKTAKRKQMEEILKRAKAGEDFANLAKEYSEDPGSKQSGGLYTDFPKGRMVKAFEDAAFSTPVGSISDIVETPYGFHVLQIIDRKKETRPFEEVKKEIEENLLRTKQRNANNNTIEQLKKDADYQSNL